MIHYCSLGFHCHSTQLLIRNNFKKESYPFDWMFSNIFIVSDCIDNNFCKLIDNRFYIDCPNQTNKNQCGHSYYKSKMFPHHDMRKIDNYNYLLRCVKRFQKLCEIKEPKVFLITIIDIQLMKKIHENMANLKNILNKKTTNFRIICFVFIHNKRANNHYMEINDNIHIIYIDITSSSNGITFKDDNDNQYVDNILQTIV